MRHVCLVQSVTAGPDMESMKAVALAAKACSLADFHAAVKTFKVQLLRCNLQSA